MVGGTEICRLLGLLPSSAFLSDPIGSGGSGGGEVRGVANPLALPSPASLFHALEPHVRCVSAKPAASPRRRCSMRQPSGALCRWRHGG